MGEALQRGESLIIFPEGTRNLTDARLLRSAFADDTLGNNIIANPSVIAAQAGHGDPCVLLFHISFR